jgi:type II secretory pathway component GspD/PulD (secretin)
VDLGQTKIIADINEPKLTGTALAGLYRKYTGKRVIVSAAAATAEFSFVQEATPQDPLTFAEAAELLRKAATIENFVFVPDAQDPNLDILTLSTGGLRPTGRGVAVYNESDTLPNGDAVISYVMTLSYIKPAEAVNTFTQIIGQLGAFGSIAAVPNASAVVITENTSLIRKLIDLKKEIDKPGSVQGTRFIKVKYSDVTELADTLTTLLTAQQATQKTAGIQRIESAPVAGAAPPGAGGAAAGGGGSGEDIPIQIIPDPRTNRIVAMGRPIDLITVESLVREFDVETSEKNFLRRKLRFLTVSDFLPIAGDALTRAFSVPPKAEPPAAPAVARAPRPAATTAAKAPAVVAVAAAAPEPTSEDPAAAAAASADPVAAVVAAAPSAIPMSAPLPSPSSSAAPSSSRITSPTPSSSKARHPVWKSSSACSTRSTSSQTRS